MEIKFKFTVRRAEGVPPLKNIWRQILGVWICRGWGGGSTTRDHHRCPWWCSMFRDIVLCCVGGHLVGYPHFYSHRLQKKEKVT